MANIIAKIRLAPGETGYYDELSNISLNWRRTEAEVREGTDCRGLRASVAAKRLVIVEGDLGRNKSFKQILMEKKAERTGESLESLMGDTPLAYDVEAPKTPVSEPEEPENTVSGFMDVEVSNTASSSGNTDVEVTQAENTEPAEEDNTDRVTAKPTSIRSLKVGASREIEINYDVTATVSSDDSVVEATYDRNIVTVTGIKEGKATLVVSTAAGDVSVSITVTAA